MEEKLPKEVYDLIFKTVNEMGLELYDVEYDGRNLRVYIDKAGGVTINTCEEVSNLLSLRLDALDLIPHSYVLEVSSPGVERKLKNVEHFKKVIGKKIIIQKDNEYIYGELLKADEKSITLKVLEGSNLKAGEIVNINYIEIKKAEVKVTTQELFKK
ncbi:MAG: ribosome maturation factor RimP [candidate division WOR-3 bacterium]|nr:ribosome maturation factor RimP [candidate division WOR-3 bacterium]MCX7837134.1 ribosome maturation factor RimP [candidate division WOR-3 bacterium]MDW8113657.1 ribosome maturation factor RimP [candidate division WOR-3 bacterium]